MAGAGQRDMARLVSRLPKYLLKWRVYETLTVSGQTEEW